MLFFKWKGRQLVSLHPRLGSVVVGCWNEASTEEEFIARLESRFLRDAAALIKDNTLKEEARKKLSDLERRGWVPLPSPSPKFPRRLRTALPRGFPPLLFEKKLAERNSDISKPAIGIVGSRNLTGEEKEFAYRAGMFAAEKGWVVFSGGAKGADRLGVSGAISQNGTGVHFLPGGENGFPFRASGLITANPEAEVFDRLMALERNRWIYAASHAVLVVSSRFGEGGAWAGALYAKRMRLSPIFVFMGKTPSSGNTALAKLGAIPVFDLNDLECALQSLASSSISLAI
ncbi:MAG TPA: DNA-processing protein DprA [Fimbriimonadales bacterium]|nr:DNA-processing protein DprA [Fimbriimonadales bacterium]